METIRVTLEWSWNPSCSDYIDFNKRCVTSVIAAFDCVDAVAWCKRTLMSQQSKVPQETDISPVRGWIWSSICNLPVCAQYIKSGWFCMIWMVLFCVMTCFPVDIAGCADNCNKCDVNGPDICDMNQCETGYYLDTPGNTCEGNYISFTGYHSNTCKRT